MPDLMRLETPTFLVTATTTAITFNAQADGANYPVVIIKNDGVSTIAVGAYETDTDVVFPVAGTDSTVKSQACKTILPGHAESYSKVPKNGYISVIVESGGTDCLVHISLGADE